MGLTTIGGDLIFNQNSSEHLIGFDNLVSIGEIFSLNRNDDLLNINGFNRLESIGANFLLDDNAKITSLSGFGSLTTIGGSFSLIDNSALNVLSCVHERSKFFSKVSFCFSVL